jgi:hypothetical protein
METQNNREMSKYIHTASGHTAEKIQGDWYRICTQDGEYLYSLPSSHITDERFGWEKVDELQEADWIYNLCDGTETLLRLIKKEGYSYQSKEAYQVRKDRLIKAYFVPYALWTQEATKATTDQVERILLIVLKHKGIVHGAYINPLNKKGDWKVGTEQIVYSEKHDTLSIGLLDVYSKGTWATILPEKATEPLVHIHWPTANVFSYEGLQEFKVKVSGFEYIMIGVDHLEEEAKKRTQL